MMKKKHKILLLESQGKALNNLGGQRGGKKCLSGGMMQVMPFNLNCV